MILVLTKRGENDLHNNFNSVDLEKKATSEKTQKLTKKSGCNCY